jgi:hypothetical protein
MSFVLIILSSSPSMQAVTTCAPHREKQTFKLAICISQQPLATGMSTRFTGMVHDILLAVFGAACDALLAKPNTFGSESSFMECGALVMGNSRIGFVEIQKRRSVVVYDVL